MVARERNDIKLLQTPGMASIWNTPMDPSRTWQAALDPRQLAHANLHHGEREDQGPPPLFKTVSVAPTPPASSGEEDESEMQKQEQTST
jgi:hypothetical protein